MDLNAIIIFSSCFICWVLGIILGLSYGKGYKRVPTYRMHRNPPEPPQKKAKYANVQDAFFANQKDYWELLSNSKPCPELKRSDTKTPPPPKPPLSRIMRDGVSVFCEDCGSTKSRIGIFQLIGKRYCDNDKCKNSLLQDKYRKYY